MTRRPRSGSPNPGVVAVGPVPPPIHGQALADQMLFEGRYRRIELTPVGLRFSSGIGDVGRARLGKVTTLARSIGQVHRARRRSGAATLVYSVGVKNLVGVVRDTVLLLATRPVFERTIVHVHTGGVAEVLAGAPAPLRWLARRAYGRTDAVIHLSAGDPEPVFSTASSWFLPNGVDVPAEVDAAVHAPRSATGRPRVLFLGNLYESKGPGVLVEAAARLVEQGIDLEVVLAGDAPDPAFVERLREQIARSSMTDRVRLTGPLDRGDAWAALLEADVVCFPTFYEGEALPLVIIEAMACARPVVATRWRSIDRLVDDGRTGLLVPPRDPAALADRLAEVLVTPGLARTLGDAGRARYEEAFTVARFRQGFEDIVATVIGLGPDRPDADEEPLTAR